MMSLITIWITNGHSYQVRKNKIDPFSSFFNFHLHTNQETQIKIFNKVYLEN